MLHQEHHSNQAMALQERIEFTWSAREREWREREKRLIAQEQEVVQHALKQRDAHIIGLFRKGYSPDEVEQLLAQAEGTSKDIPATP